MEIDSFIQYLSNYKDELNRDLEPYYKRVNGLLDRGMNSYGQTTPHDKVLLSDLESVAHLIDKAKKCQTFKQLSDDLISQKNGENNYDLACQLSILDNYVNKMHEVNDSNNNRRK